MGKTGRRIPRSLRELPREFDDFQQKVLDNQELILQAVEKRFRKARRLETGGHKNICVYVANSRPGQGELWHASEGHVGHCQRGEDGMWSGKVTLEIKTRQHLDILLWASNLIYTTEEARTQD